MTQSDETNPRPRWFQFDLRLIFVFIAAIGAILALEVARRPTQQNRSLRDTLQVGDSVSYTRSDAGGVTIYYDLPAPGSSSRGIITEVGADFVAIRRDSDGIEVVVPLARLDGIRRSASSSPPTTKTESVPSLGPAKSPPATILRSRPIVPPPGDPLTGKT